MFFISTNKLKKVLDEVINDSSNGLETVKKKEREIDGLNRQIKELELKKELEEKEIRHLVKMKEEKNLIETQKKELELQGKFQKVEMELQTAYHEKVLKTIEESRKESRDLYTKIMERLPNVNVEISRSK